MLRAQPALLFVILTLSVLGCSPDPDEPASPTIVTPPATDQFRAATVFNTPYVIVQSRLNDAVLAFKREVNGQELSLYPTAVSNGDFVLEDNYGTRYDLFGVGVGGQHAGDTLAAVAFGESFWVIPAGMYPGAPLNDELPSAPGDLSLEYGQGYTIPLNGLYVGAQFGIIRSLDDPEFATLNQREEQLPDWVLGEDDVVGVSLNGDTRLYPLPILTVFEIVNDEVGGIPIAVTYSPLSASVRVWRRPRLNSMLGVTGMLANGAMLMYDKSQPDNRYSHISGDCVRGPSSGQRLQPINYVQTSWRKWQNISLSASLLLPPGNVVLEDARQFDARTRNAQVIPYPVDYEDDRLPDTKIVYTISTGNLGSIYSEEVFE